MGFFDGIFDTIGDVLGGIGTTIGGLFGGITGGDLLGAGAGYAGADQTNRMNLAIARENSAFNAAEAQRQREWASNEAYINRDFQRVLSNTAYVRAMDDMRTAGLNPMLAFSQGGASSPAGSVPSGAAAQAVQPAPMINRLAAGLAAAQQAATIRLTESEAKKTDAEAQRTRMETPAEGQIKRRIEAETERLISQVYLTEQQRKLVIEEVDNAIEQRRLIQANTSNTRANEILNKVRARQLEIINRLTEKGAKWPERGLQAIDDIVSQAGKGVSSAADFVRRRYQ